MQRCEGNSALLCLTVNTGPWQAMEHTVPPEAAEGVRGCQASPRQHLWLQLPGLFLLLLFFFIFLLLLLWVCGTLPATNSVENNERLWTQEVSGQGTSQLLILPRQGRPCVLLSP